MSQGEAIDRPDDADFARDTNNMMRQPREETLSAQEVAAVYRGGLEFARDVVELSPAQAALFAMSYGNYVLGSFNEQLGMTVVHEHPGQPRWEESIDLPSPRRASPSATHYLRHAFAEPYQDRRSVLYTFHDVYGRYGVHPNPIDLASAYASALADQLILHRAGTAELAGAIRGVTARYEPTLLVHPEGYPAFHEAQSELLTMWFERTLQQVESGEYLADQEFAE
jgi:hypothetical protein